MFVEHAILERRWSVEQLEPSLGQYPLTGKEQPSRNGGEEMFPAEE